MEFKPKKRTTNSEESSEFRVRRKGEFARRERIVPATVWIKNGKSDSYYLDLGVLRSLVYYDTVYNKGYWVTCDTIGLKKRIEDLREAQTYGTILARRIFDSRRAQKKYTVEEIQIAEKLLQQAEYEFNVRGL